MNTTERFLVAMAIILLVPWLLWRLGRTERWAPLVVVQIIAGIALGPGVLGAAWPAGYGAVFTPEVIQALNGIAWWAVMLFVWLAGIELDLGAARRHWRETGTTAGLALALPLGLGCAVAAAMLALPGGAVWLGAQGLPWQFVAGVGMSCAVTALPILILLMEKLGILRQALGQRILRYASMDDIAVWAVLALVLLDFDRVGRQLAFLVVFGLAAWAVRRGLPRLAVDDRWALGLVWLVAVALGADWCGLHFMVGAFIAGAVLDAAWFGQQRLDRLRGHVLLLLMPVFFLSTGLRTQWDAGGLAVFAAAAALLAAAVGGKLLAARLAGRLLRWPPGEAGLGGWLLQTQALIMIIFANVLLDQGVIAAPTFTALLLMAVASTMLTVPMVAPRLAALARRGVHAGGGPPVPHGTAAAAADATASAAPPGR
jgi:Kef-type K+ transport system membrane component KefB